MPVKNTYSPATAPSMPKDQIEIGHGLGAVPSGEHGCHKILALFEKYKQCAPHATPTIHTTVRRYGGPLTQSQLVEGLGATIDLTDQSPPGAVEVYSTPGYKNGEFQQHVLVMGIGIHLHAPPTSFLARGNAFLASAFANATAPSFSPDAYTLKDATATTGAWGSSQVPSGPAFLNYGDWINQAFWMMVRGYNILWTWGNQTTIFNERLRNIAWSPRNAMNGSGGLNQKGLKAIVNYLNQYYTNAAQLGSNQVFELVDVLRMGCVGAGAQGQFSVSRDLEYVDQFYGGTSISHELEGNGEHRMLDMPFVIPQGVDAGIKLQENSSVEAGSSQAGVSTALSFRNSLDANNGFAATPVPAALVQYPNFTGTGTTAYNERTLDGLTVTQTNPSIEYEFKAGLFEMAISLKGWEISSHIKSHLDQNPETVAKLASCHGIRCCGMGG